MGFHFSFARTKEKRNKKKIRRTTFQKPKITYSSLNGKNALGFAIVWTICRSSREQYVIFLRLFPLCRNHLFKDVLGFAFALYYFCFLCIEFVFFYCVRLRLCSINYFCWYECLIFIESVLFIVFVFASITSIINVQLKKNYSLSIFNFQFSIK